MTIYTKAAGQSGCTVAYTRGDGRRISYQQAAIEQYAEAHQISDLMVYTDHRADGEDYRVMFNRMLFDVGAGRFNTVLLYSVEALDSYSDELGELAEVARLASATIITVAEDHEVSTAAGLFVARVLAAVSEFEQSEEARRRAYAARLRASRSPSAQAAAGKAGKRP